MEDSIEYWQAQLAEREIDLQAEMLIENNDSSLQSLLVDSIELCKEKIKELSNG